MEPITAFSIGVFVGVIFTLIIGTATRPDSNAKELAEVLHKAKLTNNELEAEINAQRVKISQLELTVENL